MKRHALLAGLCAALAGPALGCPANQIALLGVGCPMASTTYVGPGDIVPGATAWWGLRAYSAAYAASGGLAINVRNTATSEACNVPVTSAGGLGNVTGCSGSSSGDSLATFCAEDSGSCAVTEAYDQTGNGNNVTQSTAADQPTLTLNAFGSLSALYVPSASQSLNSSTGTVAQPLTMTAVGEDTGSAAGGAAIISYESSPTTGLGWYTASTTPGVKMSNTGITSSSGAAGNLVALQGVANGSSSILSVSGVETTGTVGSGGLSGLSFALGNGSAAYYAGEAGVWPSAFSSTQRTNMCHNMRLYWGTTGSC